MTACFGREESRGSDVARLGVPDGPGVEASRCALRHRPSPRVQQRIPHRHPVPTATSARLTGCRRATLATRGQRRRARRRPGHRAVVQAAAATAKPPSGRRRSARTRSRSALSGAPAAAGGAARQANQLLGGGTRPRARGSRALQRPPGRRQHLGARGAGRAAPSSRSSSASSLELASTSRSSASTSRTTTRTPRRSSCAVPGDLPELRRPRGRRSSDARDARRHADHGLLRRATASSTFVHQGPYSTRGSSTTSAATRSGISHGR